MRTNERKNSAKEDLHLEIVVRTSARASKALFRSWSPLIRKTFSLSHGDRSSKYWLRSVSFFTSLGTKYHKCVSLQNPKNKLCMLFIYFFFLLKAKTLTQLKNTKYPKLFSPLCHVITLFQTKNKKYVPKHINKYTLLIINFGKA